ncbi:MAG: hypothetical protein M0Q53_21070 [Prolixibacteraceae bacterium]|jgi:hypothetical protein|nr:hypothetical protein [Prolixibacteraceae bacterium]
MKKNEFIMLIIGVFFSLTINAQLQISYTPQDIVCPNFGTNYSYTSSLQTYSVTWTLSGGSFSATNPNVTSSTNSAVTVYWSNAVSTNNQAPKGTLKLTANYTNGTQGEVSISQNIKSLNGATPPALRSTSSTNLNMGNNTFRVYMNNTFYFPGIKQGGVAVRLFYMNGLFLKDGKIVTEKPEHLLLELLILIL